MAQKSFPLPGETILPRLVTSPSIKRRAIGFSGSTPMKSGCRPVFRKLEGACGESCRSELPDAGGMLSGGRLGRSVNPGLEALGYVLGPLRGQDMAYGFTD